MSTPSRPRMRSRSRAEQIDEAAADGAASEQADVHPAACQPSSARPLRQRLIEIVDEIANVFESDRQPNQSVRDPDLPPHLGLDRGMRHRRRMTEEALHAAEAFGERPEPQALREVDRVVRRSASSSNETMAPKSGIVNARDLFVRSADTRPLPLAFSQCRAIRSAERLHAAQDEETILRSRHGADRVLEKLQARRRATHRR